MAYIDHALRGRVVSEMHMRRMPALHPPLLMVQVVRLVDPSDRPHELEIVLAMPGVEADVTDIHERHIGGHNEDDVHFIWERHSEATTATLVMPAQLADPFTPDLTFDSALSWLSSLPGGVIRAVKIAIIKEANVTQALIASLGFNTAELVSCRIDGIRIWTDFLVRSDNFGRLLVATENILPDDLSRLIQRLQELGNYRNLALLGLPLAQAESPRIAALENQLVVIAGRMAKGEADTALLDQLCGLSAQVTSITAETAYRMSATAAYSKITHDRLAALKAIRIPGYQTLEEFTDRRFLPAARTCASFVMRLEALAVQIERATSLLRTRVEMILQTQNSELLKSMETNASRQLRLQHLVEGLSVVAVSYYAVALLSYLLKPISLRVAVPYEILVAASTVPVIAMVWIYLRWRVKKISGDE